MWDLHMTVISVNIAAFTILYVFPHSMYTETSQIMTGMWGGELPSPSGISS